MGPSPKVPRRVTAAGYGVGVVGAMMVGLVRASLSTPLKSGVPITVVTATEVSVVGGEACDIFASAAVVGDRAEAGDEASEVA